MSPTQCLVAITGASGAIYARGLIERLARLPEMRVLVSATDAGRRLLVDELGASVSACDGAFSTWLSLGPAEMGKLEWIPVHEFGAGPMSGSFPLAAMAVAPCSMRTLGALASGLADHVITRAADVCLKERRPLVIAPRETPLSAIHLENMLRLTHAGARIVPLCPGFYHRPADISDLVAFMSQKIMEQMGLPVPDAFHWRA